MKGILSIAVPTAAVEETDQAIHVNNNWVAFFICFHTVEVGPKGYVGFILSNF